MKHLEIKIYGQVQGINFRWYAKQKAKSLSICGLIRNEPNGSVLIEAEGESEALDGFIAWCRKGPKFAKVERVEVVQGQIIGYNEFEIKR